MKRRVTYTSIYTSSYPSLTFTYSCALTCGILHQLYVPYGVLAGTSELLNIKPCVPVPFIIWPRSLIQLFFGAYHLKSTVAFCAIADPNNKGRTDLVEYMLLSKSWRSANAVQRTKSVQRATSRTWRMVL
jgi:hypothetical protein